MKANCVGAIEAQRRVRDHQPQAAIALAHSLGTAEFLAGA